MVLSVLFSDADVLVCIKPRGILSEGIEPNTMPGLLSAFLCEQGEDPDIFPIHRLDKETEGLMVYARNPSAAAQLSRSITDGTLHKEYLAVLCGIPNEPSGQLTDLLFYDRKRGKSFVVNRLRKGVKKAVLHYTVWETKAEYSLVHITLLTGRTHQIRVQFSSRGLPLAGDRRYGAPKGNGHLALYSHRLSFPHPKTGKTLSFCMYPSSESDPIWNAWTRF